MFGQNEHRSRPLPKNSGTLEDLWNEDASTPDVSAQKNATEDGVFQNVDIKSGNPQEKADDEFMTLDQLEKKRHPTDETVERIAEQHEIERKTNRWWYPLLWFVAAMNFFFLCSMVYSIFEVEEYSNHRGRFSTFSWLIWGIPMLVVTWFIFSPVPRGMRKGRERFSEKPWFRKRSLFLVKSVNLANALACFVLVVAYLWSSAIPKYNTPHWVDELEFSWDLPIPAFAFIFTPAYNNTILPVNYTQVGDLPMTASLSNGSHVYHYPPKSLYVHEYDVGINYTFVVANSSLLDIKSIDNPTGSVISFAVNSTFNSTAAQNVPSYHLPFFSIVAFDPRLHVKDIALCGIQSQKLINAFATHYFSISASRITDTFNTITAPSNYFANCTQLYRNLVSDPVSRFTTYDMALTGSLTTTNGTYLQDCDVATNPNARCFTQVSLNYGSQIVRNSRTEPGIDKLDIWLNAGAVVGAVQFFAWFLLQLVGG